MELLSQLDVANPDHVSVITREGRVTVSVRKNGADVTVGFPVNAQVFDTAPRPALQQTVMVQKSTKGSTDELNTAQRMRRAARFNSKLTMSTARQIKDMLKDPDIMSKFRSKHDAHSQIGQAYGVSVHTIRAIDKGLAWRQA